MCSEKNCSPFPIRGNTILLVLYLFFSYLWFCSNFEQNNQPISSSINVFSFSPSEVKLAKQNQLVPFLVWILFHPLSLSLSLYHFMCVYMCLPICMCKSHHPAIFFFSNPKPIFFSLTKSRIFLFFRCWCEHFTKNHKIYLPIKLNNRIFHFSFFLYKKYTHICIT